MTQVNWYFDVISPFAYMQSHRLSCLPKNVDLVLKPVLFAGLLNHWGQLGPAEITSKKTFTFQYSVWKARKMGLELNLPSRHPFNPLRALRLAVSTNDLASIQTIFKAIWVDGHLPDDEHGWAGIQAALGIEDGESRIDQRAVKTSLISNGEEAIASKVFGVPTIVTKGELFWGDDSFEMFLDYLCNPVMMVTEEMKRAAYLVPNSERNN